MSTRFDIHSNQKTSVNCRECKYVDRTYVPPEFVNLHPSERTTVDLLILGEAPGAEEEKQGRPFVGRSGQVIRPIIDRLGEAGIKLIVANAVNCRPPHNSTPDAKDIKQCNFIVQNLVQTYKPKAIIALGSVAKDAVRYTLDLKEFKESLVNLAGRVFTDNKTGIKCIAAPHPSQFVRTRVGAIFEEIRLAFELALQAIGNTDIALSLVDITQETVLLKVVDQAKVNSNLIALRRTITDCIEKASDAIHAHPFLHTIAQAVKHYLQRKEPIVDLKGYNLVRITPYNTSEGSYIRFWLHKGKETVVRDIPGYVPVFFDPNTVSRNINEVPFVRNLKQLQFGYIPLRKFNYINRLASELAFELGTTVRIPGLYFVQDRPEQTWAQMLSVIGKNIGSDLHIWYIDIEVMHEDTGQFPNPNQAEHPVVVVTIYDSAYQDYHSFVLKHTLPKDSIVNEILSASDLKDRFPDQVETLHNLTIHTAQTEKQLFEQLLNLLGERKPNILTGWNVYFDIVYMYNRAGKLGCFKQKDLSQLINYLATEYYGFPNSLQFEPKLYYPANIFEAERAAPFANILLHETFDMLSMYKWMTTGEKRSYSLEYTAKSVLRVSGKLKHTGSIKYLFEKNPLHLVAYNVLDVVLTVLLDDALMLTSMANEISHITGQTFLREYSHLRVFPPSLYLYGLKALDKAIVGTKAGTSASSPPLTAAFVRQPVPGLYGL